MFQRSALILTLSTLTAAIGCGDGSDGPTDPIEDRSQAHQAFGATVTALAAVDVTPANLERGSSESPFRVAQVTQSAQGSAGCPGGGDLSFDGDVAVDAADATSSSVDLSVDFNNCSYDGLSIDGSMEFSVDSSASAAGSSVVWTYAGELRFGGAVNGSCAFDFSGSATSDAQGAVVSYQGSFCGFDVSGDFAS